LQAEKQFGYHRDELVGQQVKNIIPEGFAERLIADDLRSAADALAQQIGTGIELVGRRKDGTQFPIEIMLSPLESADGILVTAAIRNISVRKEAEEHLAQMEGRYRGLLEAAPDAMVVVNGAGEIVLLNLQAEKQFGYHRDELVGQPVKNIIPEGFAERLIADDLRSAADALAQQIGTGIELVGRRKDGTEFPIEIMLSPLESADGILVTAAIRNISVRKEAESQLLQAQKLESIGRLAGGIAHDFNNMLFVIHGYAELLTDDLASTNRARLDPDSALLSVNAISQAAERAATLTAQLLAFSRQQVISPSVLDLNAAIDGLEPMVRQLIGENMRLVVKLDHDAGYIRGDAGQLDQILVNLVVNARDAMPDGGTVTIETENVLVDEPYAIAHFDVRPGPYVLLSVTDTGVGMDRVTREHIFEPFFTTKELGKGTGLGLATTYGIVRQAGGHIWVYSEPGIGSSFKLHFPRVDAAVTTELPTIAATPAVGAGTVLVVEDERVVRDMTTQLLTRSGYEVIAVAGGAEAMIRLVGLDEPIDVLITDVVMPNMSGIELAEWTMDRYPYVGVVLLSGYTAETLNLERVTARGATFVPKPVTSGQLLVAVQQARFAASQPDRADQSPTTPRSQ
ncbi:MAG: PAS domain S-box protein, partial [Gaiellaceae bacterium]